MSKSTDPPLFPELRPQPKRFPSASLEEGYAKKHLYEDKDGATQEVVIARVGGRLYAADTYCPHEGGRLAEGPMMEGRFYHCPLHLYRFRVKGGQAVDVPCDPVETFRVEEVDGEALVYVDGD